MPGRRRALATALGLLLAALVACVGSRTAPPPVLQALPLTLTLKDPVIVAGGALLLSVEGAGLLDPSFVTVTLKGQLDNATIEARLVGEFAVGARAVEIKVPFSELSRPLGARTVARFTGAIEVKIDDISGELEGRGALKDAEILILDALPPTLELPERLDLHLGEETLHAATGMLREGEGATELLLEGRFTADNGGTRQIEAVAQVRVGEGGREQAEVIWAPSLFGVRPGVFDGEARVINRHALAEPREAAPRPLIVELLPTEVTGFDPPSAARGQRVEVVGKGFIPLNSGLAQSMLFNLEGIFTTLDGETIELTGNNILRLAPDAVTRHDRADLALRTQIMEIGERRVLVGLTANPGRFEGTVTPLLVDATATVEGVPWQGSFSIEPTRQIVFLKVLPGFGEALADYGLHNVEAEIRARVEAVTRRDYAGLNIEFTDIRPENFAEYSIIEIGGPDPNGAGLLGLDNTAGKDTGNLRLDDVIGGQNADSGELGFFAFGGVFIESFVLFSASLSPPNELTSPNFDAIFAPFMPALGGTPVQAGEIDGGPRQAQIEAAILAIGNLIGNTISHEIGHSLGLAFFEEDFEVRSQQFHNEFDEPNAMMDSGQDRPFEERAEIQGQGPAVFNPKNRAYLELILPMP